MHPGESSPRKSPNTARKGKPKALISRVFDGSLSARYAADPNLAVLSPRKRGAHYITSPSKNMEWEYTPRSVSTVETSRSTHPKSWRLRMMNGEFNVEIETPPESPRIPKTSRALPQKPVSLMSAKHDRFANVRSVYSRRASPDGRIPIREINHEGKNLVQENLNEQEPPESSVPPLDFHAIHSADYEMGLAYNLRVFDRNVPVIKFRKKANAVDEETTITTSRRMIPKPKRANRGVSPEHFDLDLPESQNTEPRGPVQMIEEQASSEDNHNEYSSSSDTTDDSDSYSSSTSSSSSSSGSKQSRQKRKRKNKSGSAKKENEVCCDETEKSLSKDKSKDSPKEKEKKSVGEAPETELKERGREKKKKRIEKIDSASEKKIKERKHVDENMDEESVESVTQMKKKGGKEKKKKSIEKTNASSKKSKERKHIDEEIEDSTEDSVMQKDAKKGSKVNKAKRTHIENIIEEEVSLGKEPKEERIIKSDEGKESAKKKKRNPSSEKEQTKEKHRKKDRSKSAKKNRKDAYDEKTKDRSSAKSATALEEVGDEKWSQCNRDIESANETVLGDDNSTTKTPKDDCRTSEEKKRKKKTARKESPSATKPIDEEANVSEEKTEKRKKRKHRKEASSVDSTSTNTSVSTMEASLVDPEVEQKRKKRKRKINESEQVIEETALEHVSAHRKRRKKHTKPELSESLHASVEVANADASNPEKCSDKPKRKRRKHSQVPHEIANNIDVNNSQLDVEQHLEPKIIKRARSTSPVKDSVPVSQKKRSRSVDNLGATEQNDQDPTNQAQVNRSDETPAGDLPLNQEVPQAENEDHISDEAHLTRDPENAEPSGEDQQDLSDAPRKETSQRIFHYSSDPKAPLTVSKLMCIQTRSSKSVPKVPVTPQPESLPEDTREPTSPHEEAQNSPQQESLPEDTHEPTSPRNTSEHRSEILSSETPKQKTGPTEVPETPKPSSEQDKIPETPKQENCNSEEEYSDLETSPIGKPPRLPKSELCRREPCEIRAEKRQRFSHMAQRRQNVESSPMNAENGEFARTYGARVPWRMQITSSRHGRAPPSHPSDFRDSEYQYDELAQCLKLSSLTMNPNSLKAMFLESPIDDRTNEDTAELLRATTYSRHDMILDEQELVFSDDPVVPFSGMHELAHLDKHVGVNAGRLSTLRAASPVKSRHESPKKDPNANPSVRWL